MYAMKSKTLSLGIALAFTLLCTACGGQKNDQAGSSDSTQMGAIALPELADGDEVVFENDDMRIVKGGPSRQRAESTISLRCNPSVRVSRTLRSKGLCSILRE